MKGNFHVQFLGEGVAATSPPYPTIHTTYRTQPAVSILLCMSCSSPCSPRTEGEPTRAGVLIAALCAQHGRSSIQIQEGPGPNFRKDLDQTAGLAYYEN